MTILPFDASRGVTPEIDPKFKRDCSRRMRTLHLLLGCPGEQNRGMVKDYLVAKGWITVGQEPEDWPLFAVPRSKEDMAKLAEDVQDYHAQISAQNDLREEIVP